jgi:hypothetical protein
MSGNSGRRRGKVDIVGEKWSKSGKTCSLLGNFLYNHLLIIKILLLPEESQVGITRYFSIYMYVSITLMFHAFVLLQIFQSLD